MDAKERAEVTLSRRSFLFSGIAFTTLTAVPGLSRGTSTRELDPIVLKGHQGFITSLAFSPDGKLLASGSEDTTAILWDLKRKAAIHVLHGHRQRIFRVVFSADGLSLLTYAFNDGARLWDVRTGVLKLALPDAYNNGNAIQFVPDGKTVVQGGNQIEKRPGNTEIMTGKLDFWDVQTGKLQRTLKVGENCSVDTLSLSPNGKMLAFRSVLLDTRTGKWIRLLKPSNARYTAFSTDGKWLAGAVPTDTSGNAVRPEPQRGTEAHNSDSNLRENAGEEVCVWVPQNEEPKYRLKGHVGTICGIDFSPDGRTLITRSLQQKIVPGTDMGQQLTDVRVWDLSSGQLRWMLAHDLCGAFVSPAFSPDSRTVAMAKLYDVRTGRQRSEFEAGVPAAFSPDGKTFAGAFTPNAVRLWRLDN